MVIKQGSSLLLIMCSLLCALSLSADVLFDPTRPATKQKSTTSNSVGAVVGSWKLESTLVASDRRVAVINGKLVSEGESVDGAHVIQIRKLNVLIQTPTKRMTLQLLPNIIKKIRWETD